MHRGRIIVDALWDEEAGVFVATSSDVPGLVTEAETWEALTRKLDVLVPELLELNRPGGEVSFGGETELVLIGERRSRVRLRA